MVIAKPEWGLCYPAAYNIKHLKGINNQSPRLQNWSYLSLL
jgi:hypothetical protein